MNVSNYKPLLLGESILTADQCCPIPKWVTLMMNQTYTTMAFIITMCKAAL